MTEKRDSKAASEMICSLLALGSMIGLVFAGIIWLIVSVCHHFNMN